MGKSPGLVPLRAQRMSVSPFTFYRGTAALMAADLARDPSSGILVASCGDAHVSNFGFYASPQRTLVFDLNDFDESAWAPWEWDLKRLVASVIISGQATNRSRKKTRKAARAAIDSYLGTLREAIKRSPIDRYFASFNPSQRTHGLDKQSRVVLEAAISDASKRTGVRAARKLTRVDERVGRGSSSSPRPPPQSTTPPPPGSPRTCGGTRSPRRSTSGSCCVSTRSATWRCVWSASAASALGATSPSSTTARAAS